MRKPIIIHHDNHTLEKRYGIKERPEFCNYPIRGVHWDTVHHPNYRMSLQHKEFLGNHLQLFEMEADTETALPFTVGSPSVFIVVMMEGFVRFYQNSELISYAMTGVMYMVYNPGNNFRLQVNSGKHALMVISLEKEWALEVKRQFMKPDWLARSQRGKSENPVVLPMCRLTQPIIDIWDEIRIVRSSSFIPKADLAHKVVRLIDFYHTQLESGNYMREQLSVETANWIVMHTNKYYSHEGGITVADLAQQVGVSRHKLEEYARFLFGKTLHKHVRDLRMAKAARLLRETDISIMAISFRVGYSNSSHFFKVFSTYFGCSPAKYRRKHLRS